MTSQLDKVRCDSFVRFAYPASDGSGLRVREGKVDRVSDEYQSLTLSFPDGTFKRFSLSRIVGAIETIA